MLKKVFSFLLLIFSVIGFAQLSKVHYIPPLTSGPSNADPLDQWFYISTPINGDVSFKIKPVGGTADQEISYIVNNSNPKKIEIASSGYSQLFQDPSTTSTITTDKGYIIEAQDVIYVSIRMNAGGNAQAGALVSKGENALGTAFRIGTYDNQGSAGDNYLNFFSLMATEDNTTVDLSSNNISGLVIQNYSGQFPIENIILNRGESYTVALKVTDANGNKDGLIGALVSADKNVVVNTGSANGSFGNGGARDYGIDQIVGEDKIGKEYIFVKGEGQDSYENVLIVAHYDNTGITLNAEESIVATINKGDYYIIEGDKFSDGNLYVSTSEKVFAYQGVGGAGEANQGMFFVPPLSCESRGDVNNIAFIDEIGDNTLTGGVTIVTKGIATVLINTTDIASQPAGITVVGPSTVTGKNEYVTYKVTGLSGNVTVSSSDELYSAYYNQNGAATSGSFYAGFPSDPNVSLNLVASALGSCISSEGASNVTFEVSNAGSYDSLQWIKKDEGAETYTDIAGETNTTYKPTEIGTYAVRGTISCTATVYKSSDIPISICPTDFDDDGIVDNLDLDTDNDGILNTVESLGTGIINIADPITPTFSLTNGKPNTVTLSGELSKESTVDPVTNSFTGTATGTFKSDVTGAESGKNTYTISSTSKASQGQDELLFFHATKDPGVVHNRIDGENFIWRVLPENKNITVWDPDDRLLIDTNYDGKYETGIKSFTGSEIHFKTNPNPLGETPYEFFASECKSIIFIHRNINKDATSSYSGFVETIDYSVNTDLDSTYVYDFLDLDSDDDSCNDLTEAGFEDKDPDGDGILGEGVPTFDNGKINERGKYIDHTYPDPLKDTDDQIYLFQKAGASVSITKQPESVSECENANVSFEVNNSDPDPSSATVNYIWQVYDTENGLWNDLVDNTIYSGVTTSKLDISGITAAMNSLKYRVNISTSEFLCGIDSNEVTLTVILTPSKPTVDPIQIYCYDEANQPTISQLTTTTPDETLIIKWYDAETGGEALDPNTLLVHEKKYFAEATDSKGCNSSSRTETKAFISNPTLTATKEALCLSESTTISVTGVPQTAEDFIQDHPELNLFLSFDGSNYFLKQEAMAWEEAYDLIQSFGAGASMYQINTKDEEDAVYNKLFELGFAGPGTTPNNHFWLGLKQYNTAELNPDNKVDEGWYWLDGRLLTSELANWASGEPNDWPTGNGEQGEEDYGQFDFGGVAKKWNDMQNVQESGNSWPVFEFSGTTSVVWGEYTNDDKTEFNLFDESSSSLTVTPTKTTIYFLEVTIDDVICRTEFTVTVNPPPISNTVDDLIYCDDSSDGDDTNGFIETINLENQSQLILGETQSITDFTVTYHLSQEDADDTSKTGLVSPYTNSTTGGEKIFVRIVNKATSCLNTDSSFNIKINAIPIANEVNTIVLCDDNSVGDDTDGIISTFNLASQTATILGVQSADDYTVTYHLSQADADDTTSTGLTSPHTNTVVSGEKIFIRVFNNTTGCYRATTSFDVTVAPLPVIVNPLITIEQCDDDDDDDGVSVHNLTESQLLISADYQNETFEYYTDADFNTGSLIADPTTFENDPFNDSVYVKIITVNNCYRTSQIDITVAASQISKTFMVDNDTFYAVCDDSPALSQDGLATFSSTILQEVKQKLIDSNAKFSAQNIRVTLHTKSEDALSGENSINTDQDFTNTTATTQPIWARIVNIDISSFECLGYEQVATLYVEPRPVANAVTIAQQCDGDSDLDLDSQDGKFPFDTSTIQATLVGAQTNVTTYYYLPDGTLIGNELPNPFLSTSQTIDIKIELATALDSVTNPDGICFDTTTLEFVVNDSPEVYPVTIAAHCDDGADDKDGYSEFDTSTVLSTLLTNPVTGVAQSLTDYTVSFSYKDDKGVSQTTATLPNPFNTKTQSVTATVTNPLNLDCIITKSIEFVVNPLPVFERIDDTSIVCLNLDPIPIGVTSSDSRTYSYTWTRNGTAFPGNIPGVDSTILIGLGGEYIVTATTKDGSNCSRSLSITIAESKIATVEKKDIVVTDLNAGPNNTITVLTETLGIGDYEYAIDDESGPYQDEPLFELVRPGIHTIYIRDKNNCGIAKIDVSVIGYKKFFTPNGDGMHDTWKVLGIRADFQSKSKVYIFDRYGKLLKELDPLSIGWDGTFNGKPMPSTDYWFRVYLEDGREFKSHFSLVRNW